MQNQKWLKGLTRAEMQKNIYRIQIFTRKSLANKLFKVCCLDLSNSFKNIFYQVKHKKEYARQTRIIKLCS